MNLSVPFLYTASGLPFHWRDEQSGKLALAIEAYLEASSYRSKSILRSILNNQARQFNKILANLKKMVTSKHDFVERTLDEFKTLRDDLITVALKDDPQKPACTSESLLYRKINNEIKILFEVVNAIEKLRCFYEKNVESA